MLSRHVDICAFVDQDPGGINISPDGHYVKHGLSKGTAPCIDAIERHVAELRQVCSLNVVDNFGQRRTHFSGEHLIYDCQSYIQVWLRTREVSCKSLPANAGLFANAPAGLYIEVAVLDGPSIGKLFMVNRPERKYDWQIA